MRAWFRWFRQLIKQHPVRLAVIFGAGMLGITLLIVLILGYIFNWGWTGLGSYTPPTKDSNFQRGKTLWDWLQLLFVPLVLAVGGFWLSQMQKTIEQRRTTNNQREAALQAYIDKISELLLKEHLGERTADGKLKPDYEQVRNVARVRTITVLTQLDARRIGYVFTFLREAGLMLTTSNNNVVSLENADLRRVKWEGADLSGTDLSGTNLYHADLSGADLYHATLSGTTLFNATFSSTNLSGADLRKADLRYANFTNTNLSGANLKGANLKGFDLDEANFKDVIGITTEELEKQAMSLKGTTMPDGSIHP